MPLPVGDTAWPPAQLTQITPKLTEWAAWYSGDQDQLSSVYGGRAAGLPRDRVSQRRGGVVGKMSRWFWGQPTPIGQQRTKLHLPIASDIATASSDLLFSEQLTLNTDDGDTAQRARLDTILEGNSWESFLPEAAEICSALGGVYLRCTWDDQIASYPLMTAVHADAALPEFRFGRLWAVTFWQVVETTGTLVMRHLERHEHGRIEHGLYKGTSDKLGRRVPLTESTVTAGLTVDADSSIDTGYAGLTASYIPNVRPQRRWRNHPIGASMGRSDFDGVEGPMDQFDEAWTSWMRDIRLGRGRLVAPAYMLESNGIGQGATFDLDREVFAGLNVPPNSEGAAAGVTVQQFEIRHEAHLATTDALLARIISGAGYSEETFGLGGDGVAATATEINARERKSMKTREKKTRYWGTGLADFLEAVTAVDTAKFSGAGQIRPGIEFPPTSQPSLAETSTAMQMISAARAASTKTLVTMLHPDWDNTQIDVEVALIQTESGMAVSNPDEVGRGGEGLAPSFGAEQ